MRYDGLPVNTHILIYVFQGHDERWNSFLG